MTVFTFHTQRTIEVVADNEEEAHRLMQAELDDGEVVLSVEEELDDLDESEQAPTVKAGEL